MYHAQKNQTFIHNETNSPATTEHRYPALPPAVTLSMDQLRSIQTFSALKVTLVGLLR